MLFRVAQVQRVDDHVDIRAVFAAHLALRNIDHLDSLSVEFAQVFTIVVPIAVGPLVDEAALFQQALEDQLDLEIARLHVPRADGQVLEVDKDGDQRLFRHVPSVSSTSRLPDGTLSTNRVGGRGSRRAEPVHERPGSAGASPSRSALRVA